MLLEGVDYYQVVFTLPDILSTMALANRQALAQLLFDSAWKALKKNISTEQGYDPVAMIVLHTWNQKLDAHWHVHALVPGGGPSLSDGAWKEAHPPVTELAEDSRKYLVDAINLRTSFRKYAIAHLERLRRDGKLKLGGSLGYLQEDRAWKVLIRELRDVQWCSHIEGPRGEASRPEHVVRYLTRYLTGGPISDHRITAADDESVTFLAREGRTTGGEDVQLPHTVSTDEFVRLWCLHIQSSQLTKTRYFGGWSNRRRDAYLERCAVALEYHAGSADNATDFDVTEFENESDPEPQLCERCGGESLRLIEEFRKPSWSKLLDPYSRECPVWYRATLVAEDRAYWDSRMGTGYSEWYDGVLESVVESAKEAPNRPRESQLGLPGLADHLQEREACDWITASF